MQAELLKVIEANLPAEVGKALQKRLADAEELEKQNEKLKKENDTLDDQNQTLKAENSILKQREESVLVQASANDAAEKALTRREDKLERSFAELKAQEAERRAEGLKEVLGIVFKSPVYKRSYSEQNSGQTVTDYVNGQSTQKAVNFPYQKQTTEEITNE